MKVQLPKVLIEGAYSRALIQETYVREGQGEIDALREMIRSQGAVIAGLKDENVRLRRQLQSGRAR